MSTRDEDTTVRDHEEIVGDEDMTTRDDEGIIGDEDTTPREHAMTSSGEPVTSDGRTSDGRVEAVDTATDEDDGLLPSGTAEGFRDRWESIQAAFVDEPRAAVSDADGLVGEVMDRLRATFEDQRRGLEAGWGDEEVDSSTEDLRIAFRRYRSFFERLLRASGDR